MHKHRIRLFAVSYIPSYRLQCAWQKYLFQPRPLDNSPSVQLSFDEKASFPLAGNSSIDALSCNLPIALLDPDGGRIIEVNPSAEAAGVQPGMTTSLATARAPHLLLLGRIPSLEAQLQNTFLQLSYRYSPYIENSAPGICTLDFRGNRAPEIRLRELLDQLRAVGLKTQAGIGPNPEIALQAAKIADPILEVTSNSALLQSLPLESLSPSPYLLNIFHSWGVRTQGAVLRLPRAEIGQRLGLEGLSLWDRAAGRSTNALRYVQPPETFEEAIDFEHPLETLEPLLFILKRFLERLSLRIEAVYKLIAELSLTLSLDDGEKVVRTLQIPAPSSEVETLFRITAQYLETVQTSTPVVGLRIEASPSNPANNQFDLFQGGLKDPNRFFQTLARLAALVGNDRVGIPEKINTHQPDRIRLRIPDFNWSRVTTRSSGNLKIGPALRRYRPGILAKIELDHGKPIMIQSDLVAGKIRETRGPWKLSGNWWDPSHWEVEEWDIQLENGHLFRLAQSADCWEVVGVYD
jgi:protein ImuB